MKTGMLGKGGNNNSNYIYTEEDMTRIKSDNEKKIQKLKKAAEVQMKNVKVMAKDRAKKLMDITIEKMKRQFQREMMHMLVEFDTLREQVVKKDKDIKMVATNLIDQEIDIACKNFRLFSSALLEIDREQNILELDSLPEPDLKEQY